MNTLLVMIASKGVNWTVKYLERTKGLSSREAHDYVMKQTTKNSTKIKQIKERISEKKVYPKNDKTIKRDRSSTEALKNNNVRNNSGQDLTPSPRPNKTTSLLSVPGNTSSKNSIAYKAQAKRRAAAATAAAAAASSLDAKDNKETKTKEMPNKKDFIKMKGENYETSGGDAVSAVKDYVKGEVKNIKNFGTKTKEYFIDGKGKGASWEEGMSAIDAVAIVGSLGISAAIKKIGKKAVTNAVKLMKNGIKPKPKLKPKGTSKLNKDKEAEMIKKLYGLGEGNKLKNIERKFTSTDVGPTPKSLSKDEFKKMYINGEVSGKIGSKTTQMLKKYKAKKAKEAAQKAHNKENPPGLYTDGIGGFRKIQKTNDAAARAHADEVKREIAAKDYANTSKSKISASNKRLKKKMINEDKVDNIMIKANDYLNKKPLSQITLDEQKRKAKSASNYIDNLRNKIESQRSMSDIRKHKDMVNKAKEVKADKEAVKNYVGGFRNMDIELFNTTIAKKIRNGEKLTDKQQQIFERVKSYTKNKKSLSISNARASQMSKNINLKEGDIVENKTPTFFANSEDNAKTYLENETDKLQNVVYKIDNKLDNAIDLYDFGKPGQSLMSPNNRFKVKSATDKIHPPSKRDMMRSSGKAKGKKYKEIILEQMSEKEFNALSADAKRKVIKNALSVSGASSVPALSGLNDN